MELSCMLVLKDNPLYLYTRGYADKPGFLGAIWLRSKSGHKHRAGLWVWGLVCRYSVGYGERTELDPGGAC